MKVEDVYSDKKLFNYAATLTGNKDDAEELISRCVLDCLQRGEKIKKVQADGKFRDYFVVMLKWQYFKSKRDERILDELPQDLIQEYDDKLTREQQIERVRWTLDRMHFYTRGLLELYKSDSYRGIAAKTNINYMSVCNGVNAAKQEFKKIYNPMKIAVLLPAASGVEFHRLYSPMVNFANQFGSEVTFYPTNSENLKEDKWLTKLKDGTTHVIFNRNISQLMRPEFVISTLKKSGIKVICDVDDYWELPKHHILFNLYQKTNFSKCLVANMKYADVIWCATKRLADVIKPINQNVFVVKNTLDTTLDQFNNDKREQAFDSFMWAGGNTHKKDLEIIKGIMNDYDFHIYGYNNQNYLKRYFPKATLHKHTTVETYGNSYKNHAISLVPLLENTFNSYKSELKLVEAGNMARAVIVSNVHPYVNHIKHLETGLLTDNNSWLKNIKYLHKNHNAQRDFGLALQEYIHKNYRMSNENRERFDTM